MSDPIIDQTIKWADEALKRTVAEDNFRPDTLLPILTALRAVSGRVSDLFQQLEESNRRIDELQRQAMRKGWSLVRISPQPGGGVNAIQWLHSQQRGRAGRRP